jgi:hypothetical protein
VVADQLEPARAIVVLSGRVPFRAMEAASIYRAGWAPEVWLTTEARTPEEVALDRLGIQVISGEAYNRAVLERLGVPARAIRVLSGDVWNTVDEVRLVARELGAGGADRVILVTSKTHSRRVRATWSAVAGSSSRDSHRPLRARGAVRHPAVVATHPGRAPGVMGGVRTDERVGGLPAAARSAAKVTDLGIRLREGRVLLRKDRGGAHPVDQVFGRLRPRKPVEAHTPVLRNRLDHLLAEWRRHRARDTLRGYRYSPGSTANS